MSAKPFLDSNVIVYAFSADDPRSGPARDLVLDGAVVSVQVLNEFVNVSRKKLYRDWSEIQTCLALLASWLDEPRPLTLGTHRHAVDLAQRHGFSIYDAMIIAAAVDANCRLLYSEDLQDGQEIDGVLVRNPFRSG